MAEIRVGVKLDIQESSLRNLQQDISRAVGNISPQLSIDIDEGRLKRALTNQLQTFKFDISKLGLSQDAARSFRNALQSATDNLLIKKVGFDRAAFTRLKKELKEELSALEVATQPRQQTGPRITLDSGEPGGTSNTQKEKIAAIEKRISAILLQIADQSEKRLKFEESILKREIRAREKLAKLTEERRIGEFKEAEKELIRAVRREAQARERLAQLTEERRSNEFKEAETTLIRAIKDETKARERLARLTEERRSSEFKEAEKALRDAIRREAQSHNELARLTEERRSNEFKEAEKELISAIRREKNEVDRIAKLTEARRTEELLEAEKKLIRAVKDEAKERANLARLTETRRLEEFKEEERKLISAVKEEKKKREQRAKDIDTEGQRRFREAEKELIRLVEEDARLEKKRLDSFRRTAQIGNIATGDDSDKAIQKRVLEELVRREVAIRGATVATEQQLKQEGILSGTLRKLIIAEQKRLAKAEEASVKGGLQAESDFLNQITSIQAGIVNEAREQFGFAKRVTTSTRSLNEALVNAATRANAAFKFGAETSGGLTRKDPSSRGGSVTFRGAQDIARFGQTLNPQQISQFVKVLTDTARAGEGASRVMKEFERSLVRGTLLTDRLRTSLSAGNQAAFDFGVRTAQAARRLLEWASPAQFIFLTVSKLRQAVDTIIELDTQARRLTFFESGGPIQQTSNDVVNFGRVIEQNEQNLQSFLQVARNTGIAVNDVASALVTAARVGVNVDETLRRVAAGSRDLGRSFETTVLQLVRLEGGALNAEQAVRRLRAIQSQFFDTLKLGEDVTSRAVANVGDALAVASATSTANVDELSNAMARLGTSLAGFTDANPIAIVDLLATAFKATGAEVGRLSTTFRQLATLSVKNADEIKRVFDVQIIDPNTGQQTLKGQLDFLEKIDQLSKTDRQQAFELASLGTDRRNINEVLQLASAVNSLDGGFQRLKDSEQQVQRAGENAAKTFISNENLTGSLQSQLNRLNNEFNILIKNVTGADGLSGIIGGFANAAESVNSFVKAIGSIQPLINAVGAVIIAGVVPKMTAAFLGLGTTIFEAFTGGGGRLQAQIQNDLSRVQTSIDGINTAQRNGLISVKQRNDLTRQQLVNVTAVATAEQELGIIQNRITLESKKKLTDQKLINDLKKQEIVLSNNLVAATQRENAERARTASIIASGQGGIRGALNNPAVLSAVGFAAVGLGTLVAQQLGEGFRKEGKTTVAAGIESGLQGALTGGLAGAAIGSVIPVIGTALGAAIGAAAVGIPATLSAISSEEEKIAKEKAVQQGAEKARLDAIATQREIIAATEERSALFAEQRTVTQAKLVKLQEDLVRQQLLVSELEGNREKQTEAIAEQSRLQVKLERAKTDLQLEQLEVQARQIAAAAELAAIRRNETELLKRLGLLQEAVVQNLTEERIIPIRIAFNDAGVNQQVESIRRQIGLELERQQEIDVKVDTKALEASRQRVLDLESQERQLRFQQVQQEIQLRRQLQDRQNRLVEEQVQKLENANSELVKAFDTAFQSQLKISGLILRAGDLASSSLARRGQDFLSQLEASGQSVTVRLRALERQTESELRQLQRNQSVVDKKLDETGVSPLGTIGEINEALAQVIGAITSASKRASDDIFNNLTGVFDQELLILRERERVERAVFQQRLAQSREEIQLREGILSAEIQLLQQRIQSERELRALRVEQQREFGRLLLQGPEEFTKAILSLQQARGFFSNIRAEGGDITRSQILEISRRAVTLRNTGQFDILKDIQQGLQSAISTGQSSIVSGLSNDELLRIFEQVITSGIPGGTTGEDVAFQFERQREELEQQTKEQRALAQREKELQDLAIQSARLQEAQFRLDQAEIVTARFQRDQIITQAQLRLRELVAIRSQLADAIARGALLALTGGGGPPLPIPMPVVFPASFPVGGTPTPSPLDPNSPSSPGDLRDVFSGNGGLGEVIALLRIIAECTCGREVGQPRQFTSVLPGDTFKQLPSQLQSAVNEAARSSFVSQPLPRRQTEREKFLERIDKEADKVRAQRNAIQQKFNRELRDLTKREKEERRRLIENRLRDPNFEANSGREARANRRGFGFRDVPDDPKFGDLEKKLAEDFARGRESILQRQEAELEKLQGSFQKAQDIIRGQFPSAVIDLTSKVREAASAIEVLEDEVGGVVERFKRFDFGALDPGLRPANFERGQDLIPGIRSNDAFDRTIQGFLENLTVRSGGSRALEEISVITFEPAELKLLRAAIESQGGEATKRQQRRLTELERQTQELSGVGGSRFSARRGAEFLLDDPGSRRGVEVGFRELLQGNTDFIRELRDLTQTESGGRITNRGLRELEIPRVQELLKDAGLGNISGGIESRRDAANVVNQLLKLSESFERNQGELTRKQLDLLEKLLTQELQAGFEKISKRFSDNVLVRRRHKSELESPRDFREREARAKKDIIKEAAEIAVRGLPEGIFKEAAVEVGNELSNRLKESDDKRSEQLRETLDALRNISVSVEGVAQVDINANVQQTVKADQTLLDSLRSAFPSISESQMEALLNTVVALVKVERGRGTPLPANVGDLGGE